MLNSNLDVVSLLQKAWVGELADLNKKLEKNKRELEEGSKSKQELTAAASLTTEKIQKAEARGLISIFLSIFLFFSIRERCSP